MKALLAIMTAAIAAGTVAVPAGSGARAAEGEPFYSKGAKSFSPSLPRPGKISPAYRSSNTSRPTCRSVCGSECQLVDCEGLNASQCSRARQSCRMICTSRC